MKLEHRILAKYIIDHRRFRFSLPIFNRKLYIPEQVMKNLNIKLDVGDLPKHLILPGKLISEDYRQYPCQGWVYNIEEYDKFDNVLELDERLIPYNHQVFLGYDPKILQSDGSTLRRQLKLYNESMTFYVARIPGFTRYAQDQMFYQGIHADTITKEVIVEKIVTIDYRKTVGITEVV